MKDLKARIIDKIKQHKRKKRAKVKVGAEGSMYVEEPSGHKRYIKRTANRAKPKNLNKSILEDLTDQLKKYKV